MSAFKTIKNPAASEYKEMKSKFLSYIYPLQSPDDIKPLVDKLKAEYFDARHHCYAWRIDAQTANQQADNAEINQDNTQARKRMLTLVGTHDDREPNNTAGVPILAAIDSNELKNVLIVVVRYFGGIKLGASNLAKAYRQAAQNAIDQAEIITQVPQSSITFSFNFSLMGQVNKFLKDNAFTKENYAYLDANKIKLTFDADNKEQINKKLSDIYGIVIEN